jgi:hypothetical protein
MPRLRFRLLIFAPIGFEGSQSRAQGGYRKKPKGVMIPDNVKPNVFIMLRFDQRLDQHLPLGAIFIDEKWTNHNLGQFFSPHRPVIVVLVYYHCTMICSQELRGSHAPCRRSRPVRHQITALLQSASTTASLRRTWLQRSGNLPRRLLLPTPPMAGTFSWKPLR